MYSPRIRLAGFLTLAVVLTGCASTEVHSYVSRGADLHSHRTYDWAPVEARSTGDPRLDNNPFFQQRVRAAVDDQLASRGFEKTVSPHFLVHYHASVTQDIQISPNDHGVACEECRPEVYDEGTLLIDIVDARTGLLAWRGWAKGSIDGVIDNQAGWKRESTKRSRASCVSFRAGFSRSGPGFNRRANAEAGKQPLPVVPHSEPSLAMIEQFDAPRPALRRHSEVTKRLRQDGWTVIDHGTALAIRAAA